MLLSLHLACTSHWLKAFPISSKLLLGRLVERSGGVVRQLWYSFREQREDISFARRQRRGCDREQSVAELRLAAWGPWPLCKTASISTASLSTFR